MLSEEKNESVAEETANGITNTVEDTMNAIRSGFANAINAISNPAAAKNVNEHDKNRPNSK